jgi:hypothetical protein
MQDNVFKNVKPSVAEVVMHDTKLYLTTKHVRTNLFRLESGQTLANLFVEKYVKWTHLGQTILPPTFRLNILSLLNAGKKTNTIAEEIQKVQHAAHLAHLC